MFIHSCHKARFLKSILRKVLMVPMLYVLTFIFKVDM